MNLKQNENTKKKKKKKNTTLTYNRMRENPSLQPSPSSQVQKFSIHRQRQALDDETRPRVKDQRIGLQDFYIFAVIPGT